MLYPWLNIYGWTLQVVKKTKDLISKQATVIAKRADEHEDFITKVRMARVTAFWFDSIFQEPILDSMDANQIFDDSYV